MSQPITRYEYWNTFDSANENIYGGNFVAQIFTCSDIVHSVTSIQLKLLKYGTPASFIVSIQAVDSVTGKPDGTDLSIAIILGSLITTAPTGTWITIPLLPVITLLTDTTYTIVVKCPTGNGTNYIMWRKATFTYDRDMATSGDSGATWTLNSSDVMLFEVWGKPELSPQNAQNNQMISTTALGQWSTEAQVYQVTGMSSTIVQKMWGGSQGAKSAADVTTLINSYITMCDQRIRHLMGLPYTIRKEYHVFHFNEQFREMGPFEDEYEFFDYYDPTDRVEKVFAIYSNKKRLKYPFPKNCDDITEDTVVISSESGINGMEWDTDDLPRQILLTFETTNYNAFVPADVGAIVYASTSNPAITNATPQYQLAQIFLDPIGTLISYDNSAKTCIVGTYTIVNSQQVLTRNATFNFPAATNINISTESWTPNQFNVLSLITSRVASPAITTLIRQDTSDFMAGTASLECQVTNSTGGVIIFPMTRNLMKMQYPWDYVAFWMKTNNPAASFTFRMYDASGRNVWQQFYCGNSNFNMTLQINPALPDTWQIVALKFMLMNGYAGGVNWVFVPVQYFTIEVDRPCVFHIDNYNWNDGIFFTAPKGYLCWSRSEIAAIADELEVTYSFDPFKQEVPSDISIGSAKMAGILLLEFLIGIRQRSTAFTQSSDALQTGPDKETLEFTKARLEREVEGFIAGIGFKGYSGLGAEG